jgi:RecA/RadA recombinase
MRIRLGAGGRTDGGYAIDAQFDGSYRTGRLVLDESRLLALRLDAKEYGGYLFDALFNGDIRDAYQYARGMVEAEGQLRIQLWVDPAASELHKVSWERMHQVQQGTLVPLAASVQTPFSRYVAGDRPARRPGETRPLRLLIAVSSPKDLPPRLAPIDADREIDSLRDALRGLTARGDVRVTVLPGSRGLSAALMTALRTSGFEVIAGATTERALWRHVPTNHILHFLGHGAFVPGDKGGAGASFLFLETDEGLTHRVRDGELVEKTASQDSLPLLAFLSACESAAGTDGVDPLVGLGPKLVAAGIPAVVSMQGVVATEVARSLAYDFYRRLSDHGRVDLALNEARQVLFDQQHPTWSAAVLFDRLRDGILFFPRSEANMAVGARDKVLLPEPAEGVAVHVRSAAVAVRPRAKPVISLPRPPGGFLDRREEVSDTAALLRARSSVEIFGPEGVGKTSLLKHLVCNESLRGPDGAVYLAGANRTVDELVRSLVDATHETDANYRVSELEARRLLQHHHLLVAVDDLDVQRQEVERLMDAAPSATMLFAATERNVWDGDTRPLPLEGLPAEDCVLLFERELNRPCTPDERTSVETFATAVVGNPLKIVQAAARCRDEGVDPRNLPIAGLVRLEDLSGEERRALELLTALGGAAAHIDHVENIIGVRDLAAVLEALERRGLIRSGSPWYAAVTGRAAHGVDGDAPLWRQRARRYFADWVMHHPRDLGLVILNADALLASLSDASPTEKEYETIARPLESALIVGRRWGTWGLMIARELEVEDVGPARRARALHQTGSRALALDRPGPAVSALTEALELRVELGDEGGAKLTRDNLRIAIAAAEAGRSEGHEREPVSDAVSPWPSRKWMWRVLAAVLAVGTYFGIQQFVTPSGPDSAISVSPRVVRFGDVPVGETRSRTVTIVNEADSALEVTDVSIDRPRTAFAVTDECTAAPVQPGDSCRIVVTFAPARAARAGASVVIEGPAGEPEEVPVEGFGVAAPAGVAAFTARPPALELGPSEPEEITLTSQGDVPLDVSGVEAEGAGFEIVSETCTGADMASGESCSIEVRFDPVDGATAAGAVVVTSNADGGRHEIPLTGTVTPPNLVVEELSIDAAQAGFDDGSDYVLPVAVTVGNVGLGDAGPSLVAFEVAEASVPPGPPTVVPYYEGSPPTAVAPAAGAFGQVGSLVAGGRAPLDGYVRIPSSFEGKTVTLIATADSCLIAASPGPQCPVVESDEGDNSRETSLTIPKRFDVD